MLGATRVHGGSSRATPFDVVLVETHDGLRVVGFANGTIGAGTSVRTVAEDEGVPSFAPA